MMRPTDQVLRAPGSSAEHLRWHEVLRALREARGVTQAGWAAQIGVGRRTVQRWEAGERPPDAGSIALILAYCRERGLFRTFPRGSLAGLDLTPEVLHDLIAEARWGGASGQETSASVAPQPPVAEPRVSGPQDRLPEGTLPRGATPDAVLRPPPTNLPAALTSFVGREQELADVRRALGRARLLTLTGAGGCGKTRLALRVAEELRWAYPHGVWFVELAALADPVLVPSTVASALGLQTPEPQPPLAALTGFLRARSLLLVLDNCEHLLPACAVFVEALLRACPSLEVVTTSREPLAVSGEVLWRVPPLSLPAGAGQPAVGNRQSSRAGTQPAARSPQESDAVRLFVERARLYRSNFALTAANAAAVVQICARLDGIPLAIELAAACVKVLSEEQIAARLSDRFRLLTGGSRTVLTRQQTLRATLDWSYDRLSAAEQALLRALSVFAGGFTLEAAEAVANAECEMPVAKPRGPAGPIPQSALRTPHFDVLEMLTLLVDKSLVMAEPDERTVRYRLLETVRQYAAEKLHEAGDDAAVRKRHHAWYLAVAEAADAEVRGPRAAAWLARLEQEHDNLRAALRWSLAQKEAEAETALRLAGALARFWELRGHLSEGRQWLEQALTAGGGAPNGPRATAPLGAGRLAYAQGDYAAARALCESSLRLSHELGDRQRIGDAQLELGMIALRCGEYDAARAFLEASLALFTELEYKPGVASVQRALGFLAQRLGDHAAARAHLEASVALRRELGDKHGLANALDDLVTIAGGQGGAEGQARMLEESLALYRELGVKSGVARVLSALGMRAWIQGDPGRAQALLEESLALYRDLGAVRGIAVVLGDLGIVALSQRDYTRAATLCRESLTICRDSDDAWEIGRFLPVLAGAVFGQGQGEQAARLCGAAAALRERLGTPLPPVVRRAHDRMVADMRQALGEQAFTVAWAAGEAMALEAALADALTDAPPAATSSEQ